MAPSAVAIAAVALLGAAAAEVPGCFYYNFDNEDPGLRGSFIYEDVNTAAPIPMDVPNATACQALCVQSQNCSVFTLYPAKQQCWLQTATARLTVKYGSDIAVVGPRECPATPLVCSALPNASFPAATPQESMASWPTGFQPRKSVCWPRVQDPLYYYKADPCLPATVLQPVRGCQYLLGPVKVTPGKTCKDMCLENAMCASWSFSNATGECRNGIGVNCRPANESTKEGERLARGSIRKLLDLSGVRFSPPTIAPTFLGGRQTNLFENVFAADIWPSLPEAIRACREVCHSYLGCQYWQYDNTTGCFVDTSGFTMELVQPLTSQYLIPNVTTVVAGEFIQHLCTSSGSPTQPGTANPASTWWPTVDGSATGSPSASAGEGTDSAFGGRFWLLVLGLGACAALVCAVAICCFMGAYTGVKDKGGRRKLKASQVAREASATERLPLMEDVGPLPKMGATAVVQGQPVPTFGMTPPGVPAMGVLVPQYVMPVQTVYTTASPFPSGAAGSWQPTAGLQPPVLPQVIL